MTIVLPWVPDALRVLGHRGGASLASRIVDEGKRFGLEDEDHYRDFPSEVDMRRPNCAIGARQ
ncbi:hypothetical protein [Thiomonas sp. FB-Cd]|uniref:hypothetical protein n=1 Tax=Thiomonas sp. FB-Cd TaxID=1158292 RepID=UPI0004DFCA93|nr:hypothetical protein [Thiomonas sp. FB-Cd]